MEKLAAIREKQKAWKELHRILAGLKTHELATIALCLKENPGRVLECIGAHIITENAFVTQIGPRTGTEALWAEIARKII
jgi:hypothetical protein